MRTAAAPRARQLLCKMPLRRRRAGTVGAEGARAACLPALLAQAVVNIEGGLRPAKARKLRLCSFPCFSSLGYCLRLLHLRTLRFRTTLSEARCCNWARHVSSACCSKRCGLARRRCGALSLSSRRHSTPAASAGHPSPRGVELLRPCSCVRFSIVSPIPPVTQRWRGCSWMPISLATSCCVARPASKSISERMRSRLRTPRHLRSGPPHCRFQLALEQDGLRGLGAAGQLSRS